MPNFYSRLEENFKHPVSKIREVTELLMDKYDEVLDNAFLAYGMNREFLLMHKMIFVHLVSVQAILLAELNLFFIIMKLV